MTGRRKDPLDAAFQQLLDVVGKLRTAAEEVDAPAPELDRILQRVSALQRRWRRYGLTRGAK
jgi:DNA repair ATPase RecN